MKPSIYPRSPSILAGHAPPQITSMLVVILEELPGYPGLPGVHKHDPRSGRTVSRNFQLALRSCLFRIEVVSNIKVSEPS
jgi:hypothetical protein